MIRYYLYIYLPYLIILGIIACAIYFALRKRGTQKRQLRKIASAFSLSFADSSPADVVRLLSGWQMNGRYNGVEIKIYSKKSSSSESSSTETTCISALCHWNSNSYLMITRETMLSRFGERVFGMTDIKTGNKDLDQRVVIKGVPEFFVNRILQNQTLQQELHSLFQLEGTIHVDQKGAHYQQSGVLMDQQKYRELLDQLSKTALALEQASTL